MAFLKYTLLRIAFIIVSAIALYFVGARGLLLGVLAVIVGMLLSMLLLRKERDAVTASFVEHKARKEMQFGKVAYEDNSYEDELVDGEAPAKADTVDPVQSADPVQTNQAQTDPGA